MNLVEIATIVALPVSAIALFVVSYQTYVTRKALDLTRDSLDAAKKSMDATTRSTELAIRTMQIEMLPSANWVIQAQVALGGIWGTPFSFTVYEGDSYAKGLSCLGGRG